MEERQSFVFNATSSSRNSSSGEKAQRKWIAVRMTGAGPSSGEAESVSSATSSARTSMLQSLAAVAASDVSTPTSLAPFSVSSTSVSVSHRDVSKTASSSVLPVSETPFLESLLGNLSHEDEIVHIVTSDESDDDRTQKESTDFSQTGPNEQEEEKSEEISDPEPNPPLTLMPQSPHFLPLQRFPPLLRGNLMVAWNVTLKEAVEQIHTLTEADDFWDRARELWKVLGELQSMGYNVIPFRRRLVEMTEVVIKLKQSKAKIFQLKTKADNHTLEIINLEYMVWYLQERSKREEASKTRVLNEVDKMENELSKYNDELANLATKSFDIND